MNCVISCHDVKFSRLDARSAGRLTARRPALAEGFRAPRVVAVALGAAPNVCAHIVCVGCAELGAVNMIAHNLACTSIAVIGNIFASGAVWLLSLIHI